MRVDAVFTNGRIRTMDAARPEASSLAVLGGRVVALDGEAEALARGADRVVDLGGAPVVPGFSDVHHHMLMRGQRLRGVDLRPSAVTTMDDVDAAIRAAAGRAEPGAWIYGSGYNQQYLQGKHLTAKQLDALAPRNPVWIEHVSGHMGVASSLAFERAGFASLADVPDVDGGIVDRTPDGAAEGLVQERAMDLITTVFKPLPLDELVECIATGSDTALAEGITTIAEPGVGTIRGIGSSPLDVHAYQLARERGRLGVRAHLMPYITALHDVVAGEVRASGLDLGVRSGFGDDRLRIGPVKVLTDGSLVGKSAAMSCHYHGEQQSGIMAWDVDELSRILRGAYEIGFRLAIHAIGDRAVDHALDIIEGVQRDWPRERPRNRIEHFHVASQAQIERAARLGVIPVPQGRFITELGDGVMAAMGPERTPLTYRFGSLVAAGLTVPGSSDAPVAEASPILAIHDLVNRRTASGAPFSPDEAITAEQGLRAYTVESAIANDEDDRKGTLAPGMLADFVVLSDDLVTVAPERIRDVQVGATVVGGDIAFDAGALG